MNYREKAEELFCSLFSVKVGPHYALTNWEKAKYLEIEAALRDTAQEAEARGRRKGLEEALKADVRDVQWRPYSNTHWWDGTKAKELAITRLIESEDPGKDECRKLENSRHFEESGKRKSPACSKGVEVSDE